MKNAIIEADIKEICKRVDLSVLNGKKVMVTGGTGLLGTYFLNSIAYIKRQGYGPASLYIVVRSGLPEHLKFLEQEDYVTLLHGDLTDDSFCSELPCADYIIHAAGYGQPARFSVDEAKTLKINTAATFHLLDKCLPGGRFLFMSSSGIYNGLQKETFTEEDIGTTNTLHPRACYIEGKRCGEAICNAYRKKGVMAVAARLSYTYGPGVRKDDDRALYAFIRRAIEEKQVYLLDGGSAERIYCYISDAIEMLWNVFLYGKTEIYNVAGIHKTTIRELAACIAAQEDVPLKVDAGKGSEGIKGNAPTEHVDIAKYLGEFSQKEFINIDEGLSRTIQWIRAMYY